MTLNEWEQSNIEVLTSLEMGEWLYRRENRLLEQIRSEQKALITTNSTPDYSNGVMNCLNIIDNYR